MYESLQTQSQDAPDNNNIIVIVFINQLPMCLNEAHSCVCTDSCICNLIITPKVSNIVLYQTTLYLP